MTFPPPEIEARAPKHQASPFVSKEVHSTYWILGVILGVFLAPIVYRELLKLRVEHHPMSCFGNLRMIDGAKQQWATANQITNQLAVPKGSDLAPVFRNGSLPKCPQGGTYTINALNAVPTCSKGVSLGHTL